LYVQGLYERYDPHFAMPSPRPPYYFPTRTPPSLSYRELFSRRLLSPGDSLEVLWFGSFAHLHEEYNGRSWWRAQVMELADVGDHGVRACRVAYVGWDGWNEWVDVSRLRWLQAPPDGGDAPAVPSEDQQGGAVEEGTIPVGTVVEVRCRFDENHPDVWMEGTIESSRVAAVMGTEDVLTQGDAAAMLAPAPVVVVAADILLYSVRSIVVTGHEEADEERVTVERRREDIRIRSLIIRRDS
jgi:hypothetical protein